MSLGLGQGAAGSIAQSVNLLNISNRACTLEGYPGMQMLSASGHALATHVHRGASVTVRARPVTLVTLAPGGKAAFDIGYADATGFGNKRCPTSARVKVTPPNDRKALTIKWRLQPYGGSDPAPRVRPDQRLAGSTSADEREAQHWPACPRRRAAATTFEALLRSRRRR